MASKCRPTARRRSATALLTVLALSCLLGGCRDETSPPSSGDQAPPSSSPARPEANDPEPPPTIRSVSVLGLAEQRHRGDRLRLGAVRERTAAFMSYDVTYRSRSTAPGGEESYTISGVLNVPRG